VLGLAWAYVAHTDSRVNLRTLQRQPGQSADFAAIRQGLPTSPATYDRGALGCSYPSKSSASGESAPAIGAHRSWSPGAGFRG
jgi:hypothetical protein